MKWLSLDSPFMVALGKMADLMWINILTLLLCVPVVTAGAAFTAMNYVALKIVRDEECYITKAYFHSFKQNFLQATGLWLIVLAFVGMIVADLYLISTGAISIPYFARWALLGIAIIVLMIAIMIFPIQARFSNTVMGTIKSAFTVAILQFPKTLVVLVMYGISFAIAIYYIQILPLFIVFGFSAPAFVNAKFCDKLFKKLEDKYYEEHPEQSPDYEAETGDEHIFNDNAELISTEGTNEKGK